MFHQLIIIRRSQPVHHPLALPSTFSLPVFRIAPRSELYNLGSSELNGENLHSWNELVPPGPGGYHGFVATEMKSVFTKFVARCSNMIFSGQIDGTSTAPTPPSVRTKTLFFSSNFVFFNFYSDARVAK